MADTVRLPQPDMKMEGSIASNNNYYAALPDYVAKSDLRFVQVADTAEPPLRNLQSSLLLLCPEKRRNQA